MNPDWLFGYLEGQGRFSIVLKKSGISRGLQVVADFSVKSDDSELLESISGRLGGKVYPKNDSYVLKITKLEEVLEVVDFFKHGEFKSKTQEERFKRWKVCVKLIESGQHLTKDGMLAIATLRNKLHSKDKWNKKSFCDIRTEVDPCEVYKRFGKIPAGCDKCKGVCK
jgi:hypothetical protein